VFAVSPVLLMKDRKSDIEAQGMKNAHIRDAVALCHFIYMLEEGVSYMKIFSKKTKYRNNHIIVLSPFKIF
jgi:Xaa-Pro aminopeptidase